MCEVEAQGLPGQSGVSGVERLHSSCPEEEETAENGPEALGELRNSANGSAGSRRSSRGSKEETLGVTPRTSQELLVKESLVDEGVDPFSSTLAPESASPTERRGSKTVSFKEADETEEAEGETEASQPGTEKTRSRSSSSLSTASSTSSSMKEDAPAEVPRRQRSLANANPVYRLSMKLSPNLFNMTDIPGASQHRDPEKSGYLTKFSGRTFPYHSHWKRRFCVLSKGKLYYYEREDSQAGEKSNGVINLEYFDQVAEAGAKECKKATNVFLITSQDRSFFDPGRHLFSADTLPDMKDWILKLQLAFDQIRNNNRPATSTSSSAKEGGKRRKEENAENKENKEQTSTKEKKKKKEDSQRSRKSVLSGGVSCESQTDGATKERASGPPTLPANKGIQLPRISVMKGIQLPGMVPQEAALPARLAPEGGKEEEENAMPASAPTLTCITKQRVKGPQGRRAPQNRRTLAAAAALKNRTSSLSALEYQELNDNRSESSQGNTRGSSRDSKASETELERVEERPDVRSERFDDIDSELFFSRPAQDGAKEGGGAENGSSNRGSKRISGARAPSEEKPPRKQRSRSRNGTLLGSKLSRVRQTFVSIKRGRFDAKDQPASAGHPDDVENSRWSCTIL